MTATRQKIIVFNISNNASVFQLSFNALLEEKNKVA